MAKRQQNAERRKPAAPFDEARVTKRCADRGDEQREM